MKLFISQPMRDKTDDEIKAERKRIVGEVQKLFPTEKIEVLDSFFEGVPHDATPLWYLGESIKLLGQADFVYFAKDWEDYRGCGIEYMCAKQYGYEFIAEDAGRMSLNN